MRPLGWQDAVATFVALCALAWLVERRLARRRGSACEDCPAASRRDRPDDFVGLEDIGEGPRARR